MLLASLAQFIMMQMLLTFCVKSILGSLVVDDEIELEVREIQSIPTHVAVSHPPLSKWVFW